MSILPTQRLIRNSRWTNPSIRFTIAVDGRPVPCAISRSALEEICGCRHIPAADLSRRFTSARERIEAVATALYAIRPDNITGTLHLWADDFELSSSDQPATGQPAAAHPMADPPIPNPPIPGGTIAGARRPAEPERM